MYKFYSPISKIFLTLSILSLIACGGGGGGGGGGSIGEVTDAQPNAFSFVDQADVTLNTVVTSNSILVTGITVAVTISITDGEYAIDGNSFTSAAGMVSNGQMISVRQTSSASFSTTTDAVLNIGGISDVFSVTTEASNDAALANLTLTGADLDQIFQSTQPVYSASIGFLSASVHLDTRTRDPNATVRVNGTLAGTDGDDLALAEGANAFDIEVTAEDDLTTRTYTLEVTRGTANTFAQRAYAKASNTDAGDRFGYSVALDGDTLAVGSVFEDSNGTGVNGGSQADNSGEFYNAGAVYVFTRSGGVWSQQAYVKASNTDANDQFGYTVALDGDTLAVGAVLEDSSGTGVNGGGQADNSASDAGAVYVFTRSGGVWSQQAYVKASNTDAGDLFGWSMALDGDTLAVGARDESSNGTGVNGGSQADDSASDTGAVYVFTRSGGVWSQQAYVKASNTDLFDEFGYSVALDGDTLAVGAMFEDSSSTGVNGGGQADNPSAFYNAGAVYVFTRSGGVWSQQAYVKASNTDAGDQFGRSVALDGDTLAVGASAEDSNGTGVNGGGQADDSASDAGAVYVFTRSGGVWSQQAYVKASNTSAIDFFGLSLALDGDTLAVGASGEDSNGTGVNGGGQADDSASDAGAVYVFTRSAGVWSQQAYVKASNTGGSDIFGSSVTLDGDTLAVGASPENSNGTGVNGGDQADNSANSAGAVYVLR